MTTPSPHASDDARAPLADDLALVFGGASLQTQVRPRAWLADKPIQWNAGITRAREMLAASQRVAFVGLHTLTLESLRHVVALARQHRGLLLPRPHFDSPLRLSQPVTQTATLGHLMACDWLIGVGVLPDELPARLGLNQPRFEALPATLQTVLHLRQALADDVPDHPFIRRLGQHRTVGVILSHRCDDRLVSQWHRLAAAVQHRTRMAVVKLPDPEAINAQGVTSVVAWQTGCALAQGGVSFAGDHGEPVPCLPWDAMLDESPGQAAADLVIDTSLHPLPATPGRPVLRIGSTPSRQAALSFILPDIGLGIAGHVMRFDGLILPLSPPDAPVVMPDLTCRLFAALREVTP